MDECLLKSKCLVCRKPVRPCDVQHPPYLITAVGLFTRLEGVLKSDSNDHDREPASIDQAIDEATVDQVEVEAGSREKVKNNGSPAEIQEIFRPRKSAKKRVLRVEDSQEEEREGERVTDEKTREHSAVAEESQTAGPDDEFELSTRLSPESEALGEPQKVRIHGNDADDDAWELELSPEVLAKMKIERKRMRERIPRNPSTSEDAVGHSNASNLTMAREDSFADSDNSMWHGQPLKLTQSASGLVLEQNIPTQRNLLPAFSSTTSDSSRSTSMVKSLSSRKNSDLRSLSSISLPTVPSFSEAQAPANASPRKNPRLHDEMGLEAERKEEDAQETENAGTKKGRRSSVREQTVKERVSRQSKRVSEPPRSENKAETGAGNARDDEEPKEREEADAELWSVTTIRGGQRVKKDLIVYGRDRK